LLNVFSGSAGDISAIFRILLKRLKSLGISALMKSGGGCFAEYGEDEFDIIHMIAQILSFQSLEFFIIYRRHIESAFQNFIGKNSKFDIFFSATVFPLIG